MIYRTFQMFFEVCNFYTPVSAVLKTFHQFHDLDTELDLHRLWVVSMEHLQRVWHASRERLPFRYTTNYLISQFNFYLSTPGSVWGSGLSSKLLKQGYLAERLKSLFRKCYGRYGDLTQQYEVSLSLFWDLLMLQLLRRKFLELAMSLLDFSPRIPLGTFSILLNKQVVDKETHCPFSIRNIHEQIIENARMLNQIDAVIYRYKGILHKIQRRHSRACLNVWLVKYKFYQSVIANCA